MAANEYPTPSAADRARANEEAVGLLAAIAAGKTEAMAELYDRYAGMLLGLANKIMGNSADAEEVLQEAFLQVWRQAGRYDTARSSVSTWLVLITRSRAIDRLRSRKVVDKTVSAVQQEKKAQQHTSPQGAQNVLMHERRKRLTSEFAKLPEEQRQVLEMAFYGGMTQSEIAAATETPLGTVKTRTLLAMRKLRAALQDELDALL